MAAWNTSTPQVRRNEDREDKTPLEPGAKLDLRPWNEGSAQKMPISRLRMGTPSKSPWHLGGTPKVTVSL